MAISNLSKSYTNIFDKVQQAIPVLTNLRNLYLKITLAGKEYLLKLMFEGDLIYDGSILRTPKLHPALLIATAASNKKGLLLSEKPFQCCQG